ncbi:MAG: polysaccharide deacetylase family protein [Saprospiraceae bacterium]|nr:polysaccharide deacetylase family protein [Saprospiraceae bacterium]
MRSNLILCLLVPIVVCQSGFSQNTLQERLGYSVDAKVVIIHADDLGVAHAENTASIDALENGSVTSASAMVPCPWFREVAEYAKANDGKHDLGLHLTVTCEWKNYKWGPVASLDQVSTLVDSVGHFHSDCASFAEGLDLEELEIELTAQVEKAISMGLNPTHLDTHMGCLFFQNPQIFEIYLNLGKKYGLPAFVSEDLFAIYPALKTMMSDDDILIKKVYSASPRDFAAGMSQYYEKVLRSLQPGLSIVIIHAALDSPEMQAITVDHPDWGAAWRQAEYDFFISDDCKKIIQEEGIHLVTWREVGQLTK